MKWAQQESPSSHWTIALSDQWYWVGIISIFIAHLFLATILPPAEDELYYWAWSKIPSLSYFDHPPMTAWWIALSTRVLGQSIFAIRFPAILAHSIVLYQLGKLSPNKNILGLLLLTPLSLFGSVIMTPDIPLVLFWVGYLQWVLLVEAQFSTWGDDPITRVYRQCPVGYHTWGLGGLFLGLGLLSKYTMALAPLCVFFLLASRYRLKAWIKGFSFHLVVAFLLFSPVLLFNWKHGFAPFKFQWAHTQASVTWNFVFTFLGGQILILGALPLFMLPWILFQFKNYSRISKFRVLSYFFVLPFFFFLYKSTHHFLEANWALVAYLSFWPLAAQIIEQTSLRPLAHLLVFMGFLVPLSVSSLLFWHLAHPLSWLPIHQDRTSKLSAQFQLAEQIVKRTHALPSTTIYLPTYQWTSYFRFLGSHDAQQLKEASRDSHFTLSSPTDLCSSASLLYLKGADDPVPESLRCFQKQRPIEQYRLEVRGQEVEKWLLIEFSQPSNKK